MLRGEDGGASEFYTCVPAYVAEKLASEHVM
jgi:hypothetical protein